jgi:uncharacterized protein YwgA
MPLLFSGTWEHALLAVTAREAAKHPAAGYLGRTALQKIFYFLQIAGVPHRHAFDVYHYGPYCDRVSRDVELLLADGVLKDVSASPDKYSNYRPDAGADELIEAHASALGPHLKKISTVVESLLPLDPSRLELLATLDYLHRQLRAGGGTGPWADRVIARFLQVKKDKFQEEDVRAAYDSMVRAGLAEQ